MYLHIKYHMPSFKVLQLGIIAIKRKSKYEYTGLRLRGTPVVDSQSYKIYLDKNCIFWEGLLPLKISGLYIPRRWRRFRLTNLTWQNHGIISGRNLKSGLWCHDINTKGS
jgi:hypothetical protein